jgi:hypothetical protein
MTILKSPPQHGDRHAAARWYKSGHAAETTRDTDAWEHETFGEDQARLERGDPEYARICEPVRQAKDKGEQASLSADKTKAQWDARVACQRAADDDPQKACHALTAAQTVKPQPASSRKGSSPATEQSKPTEPSEGPPRDPRSRSSQLHANFAIASHDSPAAGIIQEPVRIHDDPDAARRRPRDDTVFFSWPDETR